MLRPSRNTVSASSLNMVPGRMSFRRITTLTYMEASRAAGSAGAAVAVSAGLRVRSRAGSGSGWARPRRSPTGASPIFQRHRPQRPAAEPYLRALDFYAIFSFIFALVSSFPVLPALIGCLAIWRTRRFHTRGRGLAIAAVVINVLTTIIVIWMTMHGISMDDMYQAMLNMLAPGTGGSGSGTPFRCDGPCAATRKPMNEYMQCTA